MTKLFYFALFITQTAFSIPVDWTSAFRNEKNSNQIIVQPKIYNGEKHWSFFDGHGREVHFRGWNVSGSVKLLSMGFRPFKNVQDARMAFKEMAEKSGSNVVRFTISWEGVHPEIDNIDEKYLADITSFIKEAIAQNIYVILDYHQDLFSRHLFDSKSKTTGNGAPKFIIEGGGFEKKNCIICIKWFMNYALHSGVTGAFKAFWKNSEIKTEKGNRFIQEEFLWQVDNTLKYLKNNLTENEFAFILGLDPFNEPMSGGREGKSISDWNRDSLYPFYFRVKEIMNNAGWEQKILFAEPTMDLGAKDSYYPEFLKNPPAGWSHNAHFYGVHQIRKTENGAYLSKLEKIKEDAKAASLPPFLTEFGYFKQDTRVKNRARKIYGVYQGLEISKEKDSNFAKFFSPIISATQWNWDIYHNNHQEPLNFSDRILTEADAWNDEDYSVVTDGGKRYNVPDKYLVERIFPKKCQGEILHFYYNAIPFDGRSEFLEWGSLKFRGSEDLHLKNSRFFFMAFKGTNSNLPTEIFIPPHFNENLIYLVTESEIKIHKGKSLNYWAIPNSSGLHFILLINGNFTQEYLSDLQENLKNAILVEKRSPIFLAGKVRPF